MTAGMPKVDLAAISAVGDPNAAVQAWLPQKVGPLPHHALRSMHT